MFNVFLPAVTTRVHTALRNRRKSNPEVVVPTIALDLDGTLCTTPELQNKKVTSWIFNNMHKPVLGYFLRVWYRDVS